MCLKIGGWVRAEYAYGDNGNFTWGPANANVNNRTTNNSDWRARGYITADARNQTEYGTVRGYHRRRFEHQQRRFRHARRTRSAPTAPSSSGRASRSAWRSRSMTSTACRRRLTGVRSRPPTPAIGGWMVARLHRAIRQWPVGDARRGNAPHDADRQLRQSRHRLRCRRWRTWLWLSVPGQLRWLPGCLTSSPTCASIRPGVLPRSWAPCTRSMRLLWRCLAIQPSAILTTSWAGPSAPASSSTLR